MTDDGCLCLLRLTPNAGKNTLDGIVVDYLGNSRLKARVAAVPEKGKANAGLIKLLAKEWRVAKSQLTIISGEKDRNKTVHVAIDPPFFVEFFDKWSQQLTQNPQE